MANATNSFQRYYRSKDGQHDFGFHFRDQGGHYDIICFRHPPLHGRDSDVRKTHLFSSGRVCFVEGREPPTLARALELASQWAEYFLEYRRTGMAKS